MNEPSARYKAFLKAREEASRLRSTRVFDPQAPGILDASSNDYLGLARHPLLAERACDFARRWGAGSAASRLIRGTLPPHAQLEEKLARFKGAPAALVLSSGYQTNASVIAALLDPAVLGAEPLVFADKLNHASMHEGCRLAGARQTRYRHLDLEHLESLLRRSAGEARPRFILSETVFSMDGDRADVPGLTDLARRHGAFLYLDEAHAVGLLGPGGRGLAAGEDLGLEEGQGLVMGTLSKALGGFGAYVCCSKTLREYLVNRAPGFIFSTALPPACLGAADAALELIPAMDRERAELLERAGALRRALRAAGLDTAGSSTQIVPVIVGGEQEALAAMRLLLEQGVLAVAVRPPTVPAGSSRLRLSLCASHTREDLALLARAVPQAVALAVSGRAERP